MSCIWLYVCGLKGRSTLCQNAFLNVSATKW